MHASASAQIERLTDELRLIPRGGPKPLRLATLPILRELSRVDCSLKVSQVGSAIHSYLLDGINSIDVVEVEGNLVKPQTAKLCLKLILGFKSNWMKPNERRGRVLIILGSRFPLSQMRRPHSPERELLRGLAAHLVSQSAS